MQAGIQDPKSLLWSKPGRKTADQLESILHILEIKLMNQACKSKQTSTGFI